MPAKIIVFRKLFKKMDKSKLFLLILSLPLYPFDLRVYWVILYNDQDALKKTLESGMIFLHQRDEFQGQHLD